MSMDRSDVVDGIGRYILIQRRTSHPPLGNGPVIGVPKLSLVPPVHATLEFEVRDAGPFRAAPLGTSATRAVVEGPQATQGGFGLAPIRIPFVDAVQYRPHLTPRRPQPLHEPVQFGPYEKLLMRSNSTRRTVSR
jgi:hypothetical protein